ncbi:MAG: glycerol-3-phosphate dehydrogenase [Clostridiales bacterium]|jgi:glycerol-3-phosphate dehydrogenase|nr:glycerol-3-phosphate dehydrogenase [Clostridiales bacterium]MDN5299717.1 glycerol-3-phosphate dehydrogenase [Clostridiales bacterium]
MYDIAIIGAGVIGSAVARELSRYALNIVILERGNDVAVGTTKANSAIVHAGYDAPATSLKGKMNVKGNAMYDEVCKALDVPFKRVGSLVVAQNDEEVETLESLLENGKVLGVPGLEILSGDTVRMREPNLNKAIKAALYAPTAGIVEPWELAIAYCENAMDNGATLKLNFEVTGIDRKTNGFEIHSKDETVSASTVINAAGIYADAVYSMVTTSHFKIKPRRGQYYLLDKEANGLVNHVIFPCPSKLGKGILVAPTIDGNVLVGPDSQDLTPFDKEATNTTGDRLQYIRETAAAICEVVPYKLNITTFAGLRAEPSTGDFIIEESTEVKNFINVAGIKSPGLSSAPAIAERVVSIYLDINPETAANPTFNPIRRPRVKFADMTIEAKQAVIEKDPRYGRIICRCEMISEGEIIDAIHRNAGGRTLNGIKRRVRPGAGRCQGGFCGPRVMEILTRELSLKMTDIKQEGLESYILTGKTKRGDKDDAI